MIMKLTILTLAAAGLTACATPAKEPCPVWAIGQASYQGEDATSIWYKVSMKATDGQLGHVVIWKLDAPGWTKNPVITQTTGPVGAAGQTLAVSTMVPSRKIRFEVISVDGCF